MNAMKAVPIQGSSGNRRLGAIGLTAPQKVQLRTLLEHRWQDALSHLTELSLRLHSQPPTGGAALTAGERALVRELSAAHVSLREIEAALARLTDASIDRCEACGHAIPYEQLEARPQTRYCVRCRPPAERG